MMAKKLNLEPDLQGSPNAGMGDYSVGCLGLILGRIERVTPPVPAVGAQGLWPWREAQGEMIAQFMTW